MQGGKAFVLPAPALQVKRVCVAEVAAGYVSSGGSLRVRWRGGW